ncbi:hypothetical protein SK128_011496 [Halocaridina rubra]|uniref:Sushi domain-containing protein n=1 Tax=Halocaridina rubra TaxID=373956 RepID=A0AAN8WFK5_HALRR
MRCQGSQRLDWILFLIITIHCTSQARGNYTLDKCYCYSDNYDDNLQAQINAFTSPPTPGVYQYVGVIPKANNVYDPCLCSDVTRVHTILKVTESSVITDAANASVRPDLNTRVTTQLNALRPSMNSTASLQDRIVSLTAVYSFHNNSEVLFDVETRLRGRDEALKDAVSLALRRELVNNSLTGIGAVDSSSMTFSALRCATDPPATLLNGQRNWTSSSNVASSEAVYYCDERYTMSSGNTQEMSTCSHSTLVWTALPANLQCDADNPKCDSDPPPAPSLSLSSWNTFSKEEGTVVQYTCFDGYSPENNIIAISTCKSGTWTTVSSLFKCLHTGCLEPPPQVPNQGRMTWSRMKADGTIILYSCNPGYKSNTGIDPEVKCTNKTWVGYPADWECVDEFANSKQRYNIGVDFYDDEETLNYIYYVTIPSVGGLILFIVICLCCTRMDSPLFNICAAKGRLDAGYTKA